MKKIRISVILALTLLTSMLVVNGAGTEDASGWKYPPAEQLARDALSKAFPDSSVSPDSTVILSSDGSFIIDHGPLVIGGKSIDGLNLQLGKDGIIQRATEFKSQGNSVSDGTNIRQDKTLEVDAASRIKSDGKTPVKVGQSQLIDAPGITIVEGSEVSIENNEVLLTNAKEVFLGTIHASDVSATHFTLDKDALSITSAPNTFFKFNDLFASYTYHSLNSDNFLRITSGIIEAKNVNLTVTVQGIGKITESVLANGTARMSITKQGIQCLNSTDGFFSIHFSDPRQDFGFRQWTKQSICLRKLSEEKVNCNKNCALIDFVENKITSNGLTDFERKWLFKQPSYEFHRFLASFDPDANIVMDFSRDGITYDLTLSCNNCHTHPNNYYNIYALNGSRYAWADATINKSSTSTLRNYQITNEPKSIRIVDEELHYQNNENSIIFLPPKSSKILQLIKNITTTTPVYLSIPFLILIPLFFNRRAQLTVFVLIGIFILIAGVLLLGVASIRPSADYQTTDTQNLVDSCLTDSLKDTLLIAGRQGGVIPLVQPSLTEINTPILQKAPAEHQLLLSMEEPLLQAFESCMTQAKPRNVQECSGKKSAEFTLSQSSITTKITHCYETRTRSGITRITEASTTTKTNTKEALDNEIRVIERSLLVNKQKPLNLDTLKGVITFFPYKNHLISTQQLSIGNTLAWWVYGIENRLLTYLIQ